MNPAANLHTHVVCVWVGHEFSLTNQCEHSCFCVKLQGRWSVRTYRHPHGMPEADAYTRADPHTHNKHMHAESRHLQTDLFVSHRPTPAHKCTCSPHIVRVALGPPTFAHMHMNTHTEHATHRVQGLLDHIYYSCLLYTSDAADD